MDPKSWNDHFAGEILQGFRIKRRQVPGLSSVQRMVGAPTKCAIDKQPPRKKPRNLGLQAWERFHETAAAPVTEVEVSMEAEPRMSVIVGVESVRGHDDSGMQIHLHMNVDQITVKNYFFYILKKELIRWCK